MRVLVWVYPVDVDMQSFVFLKDDYNIAVDQAYDFLVKNNVDVHLLIGDLDSIKSKNIDHIKTIQLPKEKDETDSLAALKKAYEISNHVLMIGGMGGPRVEHFYAHLKLFNQFPKLKMMNKDTTIYLLNEGVHRLKTNNYVSIFAYLEANITLENFKYNLNHYNLKPFDIVGISNEVLNIGKITVHIGKIIVFESKKL